MVAKVSPTFVIYVSTFGVSDEWHTTWQDKSMINVYYTQLHTKTTWTHIALSCANVCFDNKTKYHQGLTILSRLHNFCSLHNNLYGIGDGYVHYNN